MAHPRGADQANDVHLESEQPDDLLIAKADLAQAMNNLMALGTDLSTRLNMCHHPKGFARS